MSSTNRYRSRYILRWVAGLDLNWVFHTSTINIIIAAELKRGLDNVVLVYGIVCKSHALARESEKLRKLQKIYHSEIESGSSFD